MALLFLFSTVCCNDYVKAWRYKCAVTLHGGLRSRFAQQCYTCPALCTLCSALCIVKDAAMLTVTLTITSNTGCHLHLSTSAGLEMSAPMVMASPPDSVIICATSSAGPDEEA